VWVRNHLVNPVVRVLARTPARRLLGRPLVLLGYTGRRTGRRYELPVMAAQAGEDLVVVVGQHDAKNWWRNFGVAPQEVTVRFQGDLQRRSARRLSADDARYAEVISAYRRDFPRVEVDAATPVLVLARSTPVDA
jgi:deazaflavin-dependent oxidoreductase (nitroreductase family)